MPPPTSVDQGRRPGPAQGGGGGGGRPDGWDRLDPTVVDPARVRRTPPSGEAWSINLPRRLAERFKVVRRLASRGAQAQLYLVQSQVTGQEQVLKVYSADWSPSQQVWNFLRQRRSPHLIDITEMDREDDLYYEIMEYLAGGTLFELRLASPGGMDPATLTEIVRQIAEALDELHDADIVHRDLKPANILLRTLQPFDTVLVDLGISRYTADGQAFTKTQSGTLPFMPPEFLAAGMITPAFDWWSLGVTVLELSTGQPMLVGLNDEQAMRARLVTSAVNVSGVTDPRIRLLCQGLLAQDPGQRWGRKQVDAWLAGQSPPVQVATRQSERERPDRAEQPYSYLGVDYFYPDDLAAAMTSTWETAVGELFGGDDSADRRLGEWMQQFPRETRRPPRRERALPANVRLLYRLRRLDPKHPPVYRNENITASRLAELATRAMDRDGSSHDVVEELWKHKLLPLLASGGAQPGLGGGDGLLDIRNRWKGEYEEWQRQAGTVTDEEARAEAANLLAGDGRRIRALCLYAATASTEDRRVVRRELEAAAARRRLPWFTELVSRREASWVARVLEPFADGTAERVAEREREERVRREWLRRSEALREWSRRQNRPLALAQAVAGVFTLALIWVLLIGVSDVVDVAADAMIVDAWFVAVLSAAIALTVEGLLAWEIGGRYHPTYSMIGAGLITAGRFARSLLARRMALLGLGGALAVAVAVSVYAPVVAPVTVALLLVVWAVSRAQAWRREVRQERADIDRAGAEAP